MARVAATHREENVSAAHLRTLLAEPVASPWAWKPDDSEQIGQALARSHGRVGQAATLLGVSRSTLWGRMRKLSVA